MQVQKIENGKKIVSNWKMNGDINFTINFCKNLIIHHQNKNSLNELVICPPFTMIGTVQTLLKKSKISVGAQNFHHFSPPATSAINIEMIKDLGCKYVILGHSEVKKYFLETSETIKEKIAIALKSNVIPIVCISDTTKIDHIKDFSHLKNILIAYEPISSIGNNNPMPLIKLHESIEFLRSKFANAGILYGGSVNEKNASEILQITDGVLVGGASLDLKKLITIYKS